MQENMGASIVLWSVDPPDSLRSLPRGGPTGGQAKTPLSYKITISPKRHDSVLPRGFIGCPERSKTPYSRTSLFPLAV